MGMNVVLIAAVFLLMSGIIVDQHLKFMRAAAQTDRALALAEQWRDIALAK